MHKPIGVSAYRITEALPKNLKGKLPSIQELEAAFATKSLKTRSFRNRIE
jgi:hypothetical protein